MILKLIDNFVRLNKNNPGILGAILLGSTSHGVNDERSDIDI